MSLDKLKKKKKLLDIVNKVKDIERDGAMGARVVENYMLSNCLELERKILAELNELDAGRDQYLNNSWSAFNFDQIVNYSLYLQKENKNVSLALREHEGNVEILNSTIKKLLKQKDVIKNEQDLLNKQIMKLIDQQYLLDHI